MTKEEKKAGLTAYMTVSTRDDGTVFNHFTDKAPEELKDLFLKHYNVDDLDYEIFRAALDVVDGVYMWKEDATPEEAEEYIYETAPDSASIMTYDRLQYLNNYTEGEISDVMHEYDVRSIADACAIWYDKEVEQAAIIIKDWVNA